MQVNVNHANNCLAMKCVDKFMYYNIIITRYIVEFHTE